MKIPFPISVRFKKEINFESFSNKQNKILAKRLKTERVDITKSTTDLIEFDVPFFRFVSNWNIMTPIDQGRFQITKTNEKKEIVYEISFLRFYILTTIISIGIGITTGSINFFISVLSISLGLNWLIGYIRQKYFFGDLIQELKTCHNYKDNQLQNHIIKTQPKIFSRATAAIIDYSLFFLFFIWIVFTFGEPNSEGGYSANGPEGLLIPLFWTIYFPIIESINGQTLGKKIIGLKVVSSSGNKITVSQSFKRRFLDWIDLFVYGIVAIIVVKNTPRNQRTGDLWAKTIVVGGELAICQNCYEKLNLNYEEVIRMKYDCPSCYASNDFIE